MEEIRWALHALPARVSQEHVERAEDVHESLTDLDLHPRTTFTEALVVVAETNRELDANADSNATCAMPVILDAALIRQVLSGKMLEALSWVLGNEGVEYRVYRRVSKGYNVLFLKAGERKYPSYGTILNMTYQMIQGSIFMRPHSVTVEVNTERSGVASKYSAIRRSGRTPTTTISIVRPTDWGIKYIEHDNYLTTRLQESTLYPKCLDVEDAPITCAAARMYYPLALYDVVESDLGYMSGRIISQEAGIQLTVCGPLDTIRTSAEMDGCDMEHNGE